MPGPEAVVGLQASQQRPALIGAPARAAQRRPLVEVLPGGPERDAGVVRRASAQHLRPGVAQEGVPALLRLNRVVPVVSGAEQLHPAVEPQDDRVVHVGGSGLQQAHCHRRVLRQAGGQRAASGPTPDDDVVERGDGDRHGASSGLPARCVGSGSIRCRPRKPERSSRRRSSPVRARSRVRLVDIGPALVRPRLPRPARRPTFRHRPRGPACRWNQRRQRPARKHRAYLQARGSRRCWSATTLVGLVLPAVPDGVEPGPGEDLDGAAVRGSTRGSRSPLSCGDRRRDAVSRQQDLDAGEHGEQRHSPQ